MIACSASFLQLYMTYLNSKTYRYPIFQQFQSVGRPCYVAMCIRSLICPVTITTRSHYRYTYKKMDAHGVATTSYRKKKGVQKKQLKSLQIKQSVCNPNNKVYSLCLNHALNPSAFPKVYFGGYIIIFKFVCQLRSQLVVVVCWYSISSKKLDIS